MNFLTGAFIYQCFFSINRNISMSAFGMSLTTTADSKQPRNTEMMHLELHKLSISMNTSTACESICDNFLKND
jgi:hypothetical protein